MKGRTLQEREREIKKGELLGRFTNSLTGLLLSGYLELPDGSST